MVDDDLADTAELELVDTDVMEKLPSDAAEPRAMQESLADGDAPTNDDTEEFLSQPGFDPYNHH